eukprot:6848643-Pyramimonas_sp.AAC.1
MQEDAEDTDMPYRIFRCNTGRQGLPWVNSCCYASANINLEDGLSSVFQGFLFVLLDLPREDTLDSFGNWEKQREIVAGHQQLLLSMALSVQGLRDQACDYLDGRECGSFRNSVRDGFQVSGEATLGSKVLDGWGHEKQSHAIITGLADALCATTGALGLRLTNTFGNRSREGVSACAWRSQYGYEHVYDYLAIP